MGVGGAGRGGGTARSWGRWREDASEGEWGIWEGELEAREHLSKRSKAVCLRRVGIGGRKMLLRFRDEGFCLPVSDWDSNSRTDHVVKKKQQ